MPALFVTMICVDAWEQRVESILVMRFSAIGDVILTLAAVEALQEKFPNARIDFLTKREYADLVRHHPAINAVLELDSQSGFAGLRQMTEKINQDGREGEGGGYGHGYDLIVDLHRSLRSIYVSIFGRAHIKRAYRKRTAARLLLKWLRINLLKNAPPVRERYFTALEDFRIQPDNRRPRLYIDDETAARVDTVLASEGTGPGDGYIALAPGASYPTKQWPAERFARAAAELAGDRTGVVLVGGKSDRPIADLVAAELKDSGLKVVDLTGRLSILESAAAIKRARCLVTNDSGLMHAGDALDVPLVAVFGPTSRELGFYPAGERSRVAERVGLECRPCTLHGDEKCPRGRLRCMEEVSMEEVVSKMREVT